MGLITFQFQFLGVTPQTPVGEGRPVNPRPGFTPSTAFGVTECGFDDWRQIYRYETNFNSLFFILFTL